MNEFINLNKQKQNTFIFDKKGHYVVFLHNLSVKFTVELAAQGVDVEIYGLFVGKGMDQFRIETIQHHTAPRTTSNLFIKGVFDDHSKFNYEGLIRIEKEGQQSHAYQKNQNLILSPHTFVESKPYLEILANDVFCTHGSSTGRLNEEEIYYLKSRGIPDTEARMLLVNGFISDVYDKVKEKYPQFESNVIE